MARIRSACMCAVPSLAIHMVMTDENFTRFPDPLLWHRLEQVRFWSEETLDAMVPFEECTCAGSCERCTLPFLLDVECTEESRTVTAADLQMLRYTCTDHHIVHPDMELWTMCPGESVRMFGFVVLNTGDVHNKFNPCATFHFTRSEESPFSFTYTIRTTGVLRPSTLFEKALLARDQESEPDPYDPDFSGACWLQRNTVAGSFAS